MEELEKYMRALLIFEIDAAREEGQAGHPAVLLSRAGFTNPEIAELLNKTSNAVKKTVLRARKKGKGK